MKRYRTGVVEEGLDPVALTVSVEGRNPAVVRLSGELDLATVPEPGKGPSCLWKGIPVNCGPNGLPYDHNLLYHQEADGTFRDVSERSGVARVKERYAMTAAAADLDGDGWTDIYVACD